MPLFSSSTVINCVGLNKCSVMSQSEYLEREQSTCKDICA